MRKALVVGVDDYEQCPLYGCCNDADDIANILSRNEDGSPNFSVRLEKNVMTFQEITGFIDFNIQEP